MQNNVARRPSTVNQELMELKGKKVIALGERDGIPGTAIADLVKTAGADVVLTLTQCYV